MNDGIFSSYDSFFCGSTQSSDFTTSMHLIEPHDFAPASNYFNEPPQQQNQQQHVHQPISFSAVLPHASQQNTNTTFTHVNCINALPTTTIAQSTSTTAATHNTINASNTPFGNIPFVQIHTTDVQPQRIHNSKVFRRTAANNHKEIKSETIKSENADATKDRVNGTPTPPVRSASGNGNSERASSPAEDGNPKSGNDACSTSIANDVAVTEHTNRTTADRTIAYPNVYKCDQCPFISLTESNVATHITATHCETLFCHEERRLQSRIDCPGCDNIFYVLSSLETHLREDHLMVAEDSSQLISIAKEILIPSQKQCTDADINANTLSSISKTANNDSQRKSRIYLKNVEYLREPRREPIKQLENQISVSYNFEITNNSMGIGDSNVMEGNEFFGVLEDQHIRSHNNNINTTTTTNNKISPNSQKQKISIKSVDVLREPALLRRDYEMQNFNNLMNVCNDLDLPPINSNEQFVYESQNESTTNNLLCSNDVNMSNNLNNFEKPRRPKIFIKNVDILKKPMTFSSNINSTNLQESNQFSFMSQTLPQSVNNFLNGDDNLAASTQVYDTQQMPMSTISEQYLFENGNVNSNNNNINNGSFMSNVGDGDETFSFVNTQNTILDNTRFSSILDCAFDSSHTVTPSPIITEPTPPPPPPPTTLSLNLTDSMEHSLLETMTPISIPTSCASSCSTIVSMAPLKSKQKIFIKNVDILKEPQFQEQRGTLHLRTVDELNLMNKNEVENLIAPNLDNTQIHAGGAILNEIDLNEAYNNSMENSCKITDSLTESLYANNSNNFKLQDFDAQIVNNWSDDYDLGDDIDCIITAIIAPMDATNVSAVSAHPMQKTIHDLDTPQTSMISIRDIEELTGGPQPIINNSTFESQEILTDNNEMQHALETHNPDDEVNVDGGNDENESHSHDYSHANFNLPCDNHSVNEHNFYPPPHTPTNIDNVPKQEQTNTITAAVTATSPVEAQLNNINTPATSLATAVNYNEIPPLAPVTTRNLGTADLSLQSLNITNKTVSISASNNATANSLPVPTLMPVPPLIKLNVSVSKKSSSAKTTASCTAVNTLPEATSSLLPTHRGRIYVANNLMQNNSLNKSSCASKTQPPVAVAVTGGTSVRGRPFGANRTGITKMRKLYGNAAEIEVGSKCTVTGCAFRFKKLETLEYHKKCHNSYTTSLPPSMICPECKSTAFMNWNTLHTHLWRTHQIDMELYKCELCPFKTPFYSRLVNTHSKIHSEERNYKCDECEKAFKNTKQLKNHRRWHRIHSVPPTETSAVNLHRRNDCGAVFQLEKTLRGHRCKNSAAQVQCELCGRVVTSKSSLKQHMLTHKTTKRYQCNTCDYAGNDHNSLRRHKMIHANDKLYTCPHCEYKSIQSVAYKKHIKQKHPDVADSIVHKCNLCSFSTINRTMFTVHQANHSSLTAKTAITTGESIERNNYFQPDEENQENSIVIEDSTNLNNNSVTLTQDSISKVKIKVKSNLMPTDPTKFCDNVNSNVNIMQSFKNPIT